MDHFGGLTSLLSASPQPIRVHKFPSAPLTTHGIDHMRQFPDDIQVHPLHDQQIFQTEGVTLRVLHTPGHTQDHCTFWLEEEQSVFTADCILGHGTAVFEDLSAYLVGLKALLALAPRRLYPGHGEYIEPGVPKIKEYIEHRELRERQIMDFLADQHSTTDYTALDIVEVLYKDYPTSLHLPAAHSVVLHLQKLEKDGMVGSAGSDPLQKKWHRL